MVKLCGCLSGVESKPILNRNKETAVTFDASATSLLQVNYYDLDFV